MLLLGVAERRPRPAAGVCVRVSQSGSQCVCWGLCPCQSVSQSVMQPVCLLRSPEDRLGFLSTTHSVIVDPDLTVKQPVE